MCGHAQNIRLTDPNRGVQSTFQTPRQGAVNEHHRQGYSYRFHRRRAVRHICDVHRVGLDASGGRTPLLAVTAMTEETLRDIIERHPYDSHTDTAKAVLAELEVNGRAKTLLVGVVANYVRILRRNSVRTIEYAIDHGRPLPSGDAGDEDTPIATVHDLVGECFSLGDGRWVLWGVATVADHLLRVQHLTSLRNGVDATISRHCDAIERINAARATCLNDLIGVQP